MAKMTRRQAVYLLLSAAGLVLLGVLYCVYWVFALWAEVVTGPGALVTFLALLWLTISTIVQVLVFPGSFRFWRRSLESHFCREMTEQLFHRAKDMQTALEILLDRSSEKDKSDFLPKAMDSTSHFKRMLASITYSFRALETEGTLTKDQAGLLQKLTALQAALEEASILMSQSEGCSLWDWLETNEEETDWLNVVFEDFPTNAAASRALELCIELQNHLFQSCGPVPPLRRFKRWLYDTTLGSIDHMRVELLSRFNAEQVWVETEDGSQLDCVWFPSLSTTSAAPTMLLCNPNAGFYEFAYYQSEWLEYYLNSGINVFMWNYRGYGRTKGRPSIARLKKDGLAVVNYLKRERRVGRLGVHGESLGGCIATYIAAHSPVDFLFADRTFASLSQVAVHNFGRLAHYLLLATWNWGTDATFEYLSAGCYKVISSDPRDAMINDLASLKSGVAIRMLETQGLECVEGIQPAKVNLKVYSHILSTEESEKMLRSLMNIMKLVIFLTKGEGDRTPRGAITQLIAQGISELAETSHYQLIGRETDVMEDDHLSNTLSRVFALLEDLDAGGSSLTNIYGMKNPTLALKMWIIVLDIWGSFYPLDPSDLHSARSHANTKVSTAISELNQLYHENEFMTNPLLIQICKDVLVISQSLGRLLEHLEEKLPSPRSRLASMSLASTATGGATFKVIYDHAKAGWLVPLSCGHPGPLSPTERGMYEAHLRKAGFVEDVSNAESY